MARQQRHARHAGHAGAGHAQIRAERHARAARAAAHGHRHHHANTTTAITTNTTPTITTAVTTATATTTTTATNPTTQKSPPPASGRDPFWDINGSTAGASGGTTASGTWSTTVANWNPLSDGTGTTANWNNGDAAVFSAGTNATGSSTITVSGGVTAGSITFEEGTLTFAGTATPVLTIGSGGLTINSTINGTTTFGSTLNNVILSASQNWANNSSQAFSIASGVQASAAVTLTLNGSGSGGATFSGVLANGTGTLAITINTTGGVTTFSNTGSTYTGQLTVQSGTLKIDTANNISSNGELGNSANSVILGGSGTTGTLEWTGGSNSTTSKPFTMATGGTGVFQIDTSGVTLTLSGLINGSGALTVTGAGRLALSNTGNSWAGDTTVNAGSFLRLAASNVIPNGAGKGNVIVNGTFDLRGFNETINGLSGSGIVQTNNNPSLLTVGDNNATSTFSGVIQDSGDVMSLAKIGTGTQTLSGADTYTGTTTISAGVLRLNNATALPGGIGSSGGTANLNINGGVVGLGNGNFTRGLGTGATQVQFTSSGGFAAYGAARSVNLGGSSTTVTWGSGSFVPSGNNLILGASDADNTVTFQNPIALAGAARTVQVDDGSAATDAVLSGVLSGTGSSGLTKTGAGTLQLTGANTYVGATTISAGTLSVSSLANGGVASNIGQSTNAAANLVFDGGTLQYTGGTTSTDRNFTINTGKTATIDVSTGATNLTISGASTATNGALTKIGAGTLTLGGANTYTGATAVNAGSLFINGSTASGSAVTVNNSGTTLGGNGTINGTVNVASAGANLSPGATGVGSVGKLNTGALTLAANSNFNVDITGAGGAANAGITYDQANVTGTVNITNSILQLSVSGLTAANISQKYFIVANDLVDPVTGTFSGQANLSTITAGADVFLINYADDTAGGVMGNDISLTLTAVVPEPSTWVAGTLAFGTIGWTQRRRLRELVRLVIG